MKVLYIADDGSQFDDEDDCLEYERVSSRNMGIINKELFMHDEDGNSTDDPGKTFYLNMKTENAVELFTDLSESEGLSTLGIDGPGKYIWELDDEDEWGKFETLERRYEDASDIFSSDFDGVKVTVDLGSFRTSFDVERYECIGRAIRLAGFDASGKTIAFKTYAGNEIIDDPYKTFNDFGVKTECTIVVEKE